MKHWEQSGFGVRAVTKTISRLCILAALAFAVLSCTAEPEAPAHSSRATYEIPLAFEPEPGPIRSESKVRFIDAAEFSFYLTEDYLAEHIEGFTAGLNGRVQDTRVIVDTYDPSVHDDWSPSDQRRQAWREIWTMSGNKKTACMADEKEGYTGYYRYYLYCDPEPHPRSNFYLVNRIPDVSLPAPEPPDYVRGTCQEVFAYTKPEDGHYLSCAFYRYTNWKDGYQFRVYSSNLRYLEQVEQLIHELLSEWKVL